MFLLQSSDPRGRPGGVERWQALYSAPGKEQLLNTSAPGCKKDTDLGLGAPEV